MSHPGGTGPTASRKLLVATEQWFPDYIGGSARVATETSRFLAARGHDVTVLAPRIPGLPAEEHVDGLTLLRTIKRTFLPQTYTDPIAVRRLGRAVARGVPPADRGSALRQACRSLSNQAVRQTLSDQHSLPPSSLASQHPLGAKLRCTIVVPLAGIVHPPAPRSTRPRGLERSGPLVESFEPILAVPCLQWVESRPFTALTGSRAVCRKASSSGGTRMKFVLLKSRGGDYMVIAQNVAWLRSHENNQTKVGIIGSDAILVAGTIEETAATILAG